MRPEPRAGSGTPGHVIYWFRKALRLHDNPSLMAALEGGATKLYPVFCLDPRFVQNGQMGSNKMQFLLESLRDLDSSLRKLDSRLIVLQGRPTEVLPWAWSNLASAGTKISCLAFERDHDSYSKWRDARVCELAAKAGVAVLTRVGHTIVDPEAILLLSGGKPVTQYDSFCRLFEQELRARPLKVLAAPSSLPPVGSLSHPEWHDIPTLEATGLAPMEDACVVVRGGESVALRAMEAYLQRKEWIAKFEKPQTSPTEMLKDGTFGPGSGRSTTILSPYFHHGCLSSRLFYDRLSAIYAEFPTHAQPPVSLHGQMLWREFYHSCMHATPNYDQMARNPICRQVTWDDNHELLAAWREARTGYPWIDAAMTQLRREGWIHHLTRHAVACFLTRGDLWQSWEKGAEVFEELLIDADPALNRGNWMWLSCSCFFYQYFRCYSPVAFPKKYDKDGAYVRHWLPQLARFPAKYIYEPWKAPISDQRAAGCVIGVDYPKPVVIHETVSKENMGRMSRAYAEHKTGGLAGSAEAASASALSAPAAASKRKAPAGGKQTKLFQATAGGKQTKLV